VLLRAASGKPEHWAREYAFTTDSVRARIEHGSVLLS